MAKRDALFDAVYRAPDDDAPRRALAKHLKRRRDPRAEFIELQLDAAREGNTSRESRARQKALLREHRSAWLEPLKGVVITRGLKWERGFPSAAILAMPRSESDRNAMVGYLPLATLRSLDIDMYPSVLPIEWEKRFVLSPVLRGLRTLKGLHRVHLPDVMTARPQRALETIEVLAEGGGGAAGKAYEMKQLRAIRAAFAKPRSVPSLTSLRLPFCHGISKPDNYTWLWRTQAGRQLRNLSIHEGVYVLRTWHDALTKHRTDMQLERLELFGYVNFVLERTADGWTKLRGKVGKHVHANWKKTNLDPALRRLGRRVTDVQIETIKC